LTHSAAASTHAAAPGTWNLGDLTVGRIGLGAMRLPGEGQADRDRAIAVLRRAVELGVDHIDTASFYFSAAHSANELINSALSPYPADLLIATKVGPGRDPSGDWYSASPGQLRGQVEENLRQLGRDHFDLVYLRRMSQPSISEHFGVLAELREAGLIRHLGVSNVDLAQLAEAQAIAPVVAVQNRFNLEVRVHDDVLGACAEQGIAFVPFYAIAGEAREQGYPARAELALDATVREVAAAHGASEAQIRLAWTMHQGPNMLAIPGTRRVEHLEENLAAGAIALGGDELAALEQASRREIYGTEIPETENPGSGAVA
jgi:aryl-alcohol dehydrogenase-like predicted oxidoreductase